MKRTLVVLAALTLSALGGCARGVDFSTVSGACGKEADAAHASVMHYSTTDTLEVLVFSDDSIKTGDFYGCLLNAVGAPSITQSKIEGTSPDDEQQEDSWDGIDATWTVDPSSTKLTFAKS